MFIFDSSKAAQSVVRPLAPATYVVLGFVAHQSLWADADGNRKPVTTYVPCVGKIENDRIVAVFSCHRSDLMTRMNPVYSADGKTYNNKGTFVELVDSHMRIPVGANADLWWALKVLPEIRKVRFTTTSTLITCISPRTNRRYQAAVYVHEIAQGNTTAFTSSQAKCEAIQKLANEAGLGTIEGLNPNQAIQFADVDDPETAVSVNADTYTVVRNS